MINAIPQLQLLGAFKIRTRYSDAISVPPAGRRLISYLACSGPTHRDALSELLYPDLLPNRAKANLRSTIWRVSRSVPELLAVGADAVEIGASVHVDLREAVQLGRRLIVGKVNEIPELDEWVPLTQDLLPFEVEIWAITERERFRQLRLHALEVLAALLQAQGRYGEALEAAGAVVRAEPLRESACRCLVAIHKAEGNHGEAVRAFNDFTRVLETELGIRPSVQLRRMVLAIPSQEPVMSP